MSLSKIKEKLYEAKTISELFNADRHLSQDHLNTLRTVSTARKALETAKGLEPSAPDPEKMLEDFKEGLSFIEELYHEIPKVDITFTERHDQILGSKLMYINSFFAGNMIGEYPTGSGKSFMYLIFAAAAYHVRGDKTIICTAGLSLQDQLKAKDLPFVSNLYNRISKANLNYTIMKGRNNYVCNIKLDGVIRAVKLGAQISDIENQSTARDFVNSLPAIFSGDIGDATCEVPYDLKDVLTCKDALECGCRTCEVKKEGDCYFYNIRENSNRSAIVVTNYHVVLSEIEKVGVLGELTGGAGQNYVFDEAHEVAKIARDFSVIKFGKGTYTKIMATLTSLESSIREIYSERENSAELIANDSVLQMIRDLRNDVVELRDEFVQTRRIHIDSTSRFGDNKTIYQGDAKPDIQDISALLATLKYGRSEIEEVACSRYNFQSLDAYNVVSTEQDFSIPYLDVISSNFYVLNSIQEGIMSIMAAATKDKSGDDFVLWSEIDDRNGPSLNVKRINIESVRDALFRSHRISTVCVSATLSTGGSFELLKREVNLFCPETKLAGFEIVAPSPFDLTHQELWYVPKPYMMGNAKEGNDFINYTIDNLIEIVKATGGGVLGLFTSTKAMRTAHAALKEAFPGHLIYVQGDRTNRQLMELFKAHSDSILLATRSFFTGIDVKGESLRCVVIDKLPFEQASDPVLQVLSARQDGFRHYSVPFMITTLKQIVGRGVRSVTDKCVIAILDGRVLDASYSKAIGNTFLNGPNSPRLTRRIDDVASFVSSYLSDK